MDQVTDEQKQSLTKAFAIVGFIAIIIFAVWLAVHVVRIVPPAFSSLASIAQSISNYSSSKQSLEVTSQNSVVNAGESVTISWTKMRKDGSYSFSYACTDGVSVDAKDESGAIVPLTCDDPLPMDGATSIDVLVASEKVRFVDVPYTVTFTPADKNAASVSTTKSLTIVNASIPTTGKPAAATVSTTSQGTQTTSTTPTKTTTYKPGTPITIHKVIYTMPVSDPNGTVDLKVAYIGVGTLYGNIFTPRSTIALGEKGAVQFSVKNTGTKTADAWDYAADLPAGISYASGPQVPLKPNETAIITLGFDGISQTGFQKFDVNVHATGDINQANNSFAWAVGIIN